MSEQVLTYLKAQQPAYVADSIGSDLTTIFRRLNSMFSGTAMFAFSTESASTMVASVSKSNKSKFDRTVKAATGVDLGSVVNEEGLASFVELSVSKNVSLIESLPQEYLKQVETIVNNGVITGLRYQDIAKQIQGKTGTANSKMANRIKTIATNEVQTINSQISQRRAENLGITKGIYRTSEDERVRACHAELDGKEFELTKGAWSPSCQKFIMPGITDINCRCSFSPIIEVTQ